MNATAIKNFNIFKIIIYISPSLIINHSIDYLNTYLLLLPHVNLFIKKQNKNNKNKNWNNLTIDIKSILLKLKLNFDSEYKYKKLKLIMLILEF